MPERYTGYDETIALLNLGYRPHSLSGFGFEELKSILYKKYKGELTIVFKDEHLGFVAFFDEKEVLDTSNFDPLTSIVNSLAVLLLMLDKKFVKGYLNS